MAVFRFSSDQYFIATSNLKDDPDFTVAEYLYDPNAWEMVRRDGLSNEWAHPLIRVGPSKQAKFSALEVFGVTIKGKQWADLAKDLKLEGPDGQTYRLWANRRGLCFIGKVTTMSNAMLRLNDYFGWSRYGVKVPPFTGANACNKCDLYTGATMVDVRGAMQAAEEVKMLRERAEEGRLEMAVCKKELECTKEIVKRSGEVEALLNKLVGEKEREVEDVKSQLVAFKAAVARLVSRLEQE